MRSRSLAISLALFLILALAGCNRKPADNATTSTDTNQPSAANTPAPASGAASKAPGQKPMAEAPTRVVIPAGTVITVRLGEALSSKTSQAGQAFSATVAEPVQVDGK